MNQEKFIEKRNQWLEEVSDQCHKFALKCDLDFYVFQTPCEKYNPELLIIGINPGGGKPYSKILREKDYSKRPSTDLGYDVNTLTIKPQWEIDNNEKGNNVMRNRFSKVFTEENNLKKTLEETVMMNMYYFNTPKEKDLNNIENEIKDYCLKKTVEFIEILNPENILFLTSNESNLKQCGVSGIRPVANNVKRGKLKNFDVFIISHYGYYGAYSQIKASEMGKTLREIFN
ncbi:MAG TPA: hypothetical protein DIT07_09795 [Sphingobacteriaceae bacterium]|nr:hypothetical protein [Sphingobacteriaceae bacterium]